MKSTGVFLLFALLAPLAVRAAEWNLATLSCDKYENEIVGAADDSPNADPSKHPDAIDTVMWLSGFAVGKAGDHVMYGDALTSFGFALDAECKNNPSTSLLQAITTIRPKRDKPMDLTTLNCATWVSRHEQSTRSDPDSAGTIMMWLFGFSVGQSGTHLFDASGVTRFASALQKRCAEHPDDTLFDALTAMHAPPNR
jgi:HdeA/HdeB family